MSLGVMVEVEDSQMWCQELGGGDPASKYISTTPAHVKETWLLGITSLLPTKHTQNIDALNFVGVDSVCKYHFFGWAPKVRPLLNF